MNDKLDQKFMSLAFEEAKKARLVNEVPIGSIIVDKNKKVLSQSYNLRETLQDPTAHAEILAIREASLKLKTWRLTDTTIYVTLEPCAMCMGAIISSRIKRVVFGARDEKAGALISNYQLGLNDNLNHKVETTQGILESECSNILKEFFRDLRE
ncbi:MAG: tRNA-specific adenosine deaminase [Candidatus Dadabacteria bacterium]|nr:tRNA-specific adenosine deaminase [Candidatus Dadabacteria bacterium]NIQ17054.1 tRNA-specific adenosine deaminase [Candidatus Dadabacteria bacterium]